MVEDQKVMEEEDSTEVVGAQEVRHLAKVVSSSQVVGQAVFSLQEGLVSALVV